jgi:hypothetical protein
VVVNDEPVNRHVKWFAAGCMLIGVGDALAIIGSLTYVASLGLLLDPGALVDVRALW